MGAAIGVGHSNVIDVVAGVVTNTPVPTVLVITVAARCMVLVRLKLQMVSCNQMIS